MPATPAIVLTDVAKSYGQRHALDGVSLRVEPGEMVALIGPSGSGKSTLLRSVAGLVRIDRGDGRVEVLGQPVQADGRLSPGVRSVRTRVGFIFQQFNLVERLSLFTNVMIGALGRLGPWRGLLGRWSAADTARAMAALERVGVVDQAGQRAGTLSGGQKQRGAIARALVQRAELLLADEPVASLDPVSARRVMELLKTLNRDEGLTVLVTLHQVDYALRFCPRIVALKAGKVVYDGLREGLSRTLLVETYGPEIEDVFWEGDAGGVVRLEGEAA